MELPSKFTVDIQENNDIQDEHKRAREWCGSFVGAMVWLSSVIPSATYTFRGHADVAWNLDSSLKRAKQPKNIRRLKQDEDAILAEIASDFWFRRQFGFIPADNSTHADYERTVAALQHHGVPTRLLDVTADPLVALYFAVVGSKSVSDMDECDGAVIFIRSFGANDGLPIHLIKAPQISERVTAQRARFIAPTDSPPGTETTGTVAFDFSHVDVANKSGTNFDRLVDKYLTGDFSGRPPEKAPNLLLFKVPGALKPACRSVLKSLGVSARTLFPGSDGYSRDFAGF